MLSGLPDDLQTFLLDTAALPVLTGAICDQVTGRTDSAAVLEHLEHHQLFTIAIDQRGTYRYHEVLRAHLDACLQQRRGATAAAAHHRRIGALLEHHGLVEHALHAYSRAADWESVGRLVIDRVVAPPFAGPIVGDAWIELVPSPIVENDPYLVLARARERTVNGRFGAAMRDYDRASTGASIEALVRTCVDERAMLAVYSGQHDDRLVDTPDVVPLGWLGELRRAAQTPAAELDALAVQLTRSTGDVGHPELRSELGRGLAVLLIGRPELAHTIFREVLLDARADSRVAAVADLGLVLAEAMFAATRGAPTIAVERVDKVVSILERCGLGWAARVARASLALTSQADGVDAARAVREDCLRDADRWGAAQASLFIAVGLAQRGNDSAPAFDECATAFAELDAHAVEVFIDRARTLFLPTDSARATAPLGPSMRVHCFDALELVIDHRKVDLSTVRPRALSVMRVLAVHAGRAVHCETLMHSLWPDVEPEAARHSLQVAVSSLRKAIPSSSDRAPR